MAWSKKIKKAVSKVKNKIFPTARTPKIKEPFIDRMGKAYVNNRPLLIFASSAALAYISQKANQKATVYPMITLGNQAISLATGLKDKFNKPTNVTMPNITKTVNNYKQSFDAATNRYDPSKIIERNLRRIKI